MRMRVRSEEATFVVEGRLALCLSAVRSMKSEVLLPFGSDFDFRGALPQLELDQAGKSHLDLTIEPKPALDRILFCISSPRMPSKPPTDRFLSSCSARPGPRGGLRPVASFCASSASAKTYICEH